MCNIGIISKQKNISTGYSIFIALYPVLCIYQGIFRFTVGDTLLIAYFLCSVLFNKEINIKAFRVFAIFICYVSLAFVINEIILLSSDYVVVFFRYLKLIFYITAVSYVSYRWIDTEIVKKWVVNISFIGSLFIFLQYIAFYSFGKVINGWVSFLPINLYEYSQIDYFNLYTQIQFRPTSFFLEPAMFSQYAVVGVVLLLMNQHKKLTKKSLIFLVIILSGIILSTSGLGILLSVGIVMVYIITITKSKMKRAIMFISATISISVLYFKFNIFQNAVKRLFLNSGSFDARVGSFKYILSLKGIRFLFGYGYGSTPDGTYLVGGAYVIYGCGIIGFILAFYLFYKAFHFGNSSAAKMITALFFVMFFGTSLFYNYMFFWYFSLALYVGASSQYSPRWSNTNDILTSFTTKLRQDEKHIVKQAVKNDINVNLLVIIRK